MSSLLKIGEFSQVSQVPIKTLRYYDEIGLLQPENTDPVNGYRYYSVDQLSRVQQIMSLKEIGLSLEQISKLIDDHLTADQIRGMLLLKRSEIEDHKREAERALDLLEFRLRMIEAEDSFPDLPVVIKSLEELHVLAFFVKSHHSKQKVMQALKRAINDGKIKHTGVIIDKYYGETILPLESPELQENQHEILLGVDQTQKKINLEGIGDLFIRDEHAIKDAATLILTGADTMANIEKVALLQYWTLGHGYKPLPILRYVHHMTEFHTGNRETMVIEAQLAIKSD